MASRLYSGNLEWVSLPLPALPLAVSAALRHEDTTGVIKAGLVQVESQPVRVCEIEPLFVAGAGRCTFVMIERWLSRTSS